jgi:integral membrane protein
MAFTTAVLLIVLVFVGIPLQVAAGRPQVVNVVGTMHGFLYIVYLVTAFSLTWRLRIPKWQMLLVLLAGTVPFCAFVAERKMTRRVQALAPAGSSPSAGAGGAADLAGKGAAWRRRWLSPRALVLHAEVLVVAPGCAVAGWWQATRALGGNELSWVYSVEWPIFALLAIAAWWHLVHEDPEAYRARRWKVTRREEAGTRHDADPSVPPMLPIDVDAETTRWGVLLAMVTGIELLLGFVALAVIPFGRPSGWLPAHGAAVYGVHASFGLALGLGALAYCWRARRGSRVSKMAGWWGLGCVALASAGGLLTEAQSFTRFLGIAVMMVGALLAVCTYLIPVAAAARTRALEAATHGTSASGPSGTACP